MKWIERSDIDGSVRAPASKSMTIRAAAAGLMARGRTTIVGPSECDDALAAFGLAASLGAHVEKKPGLIVMEGGTTGGGKSLDCRESGLAMRLFAPLCAMRPERTVLRASGSLCGRPMGALEEPIRRLGGECRTAAGGLPPVEVRGPLAGGRAVLDGSLGSQFLTGFMTALPVAPGDSELEVTGLRSRPYADMTVELLGRFGIEIEHEPDYRLVRIGGSQTYRGTEIGIEGDWSGAAFLLAAGAIRGRVTVSGLRLDSRQADRAVLEALDSCGASVTVGGDSVKVEANGRPRGFSFDATDAPDLFPPLAVLAAAADGRSRIRGAGRLRHKESDRAAALVEELGKFGAGLAIEGDELVVEGGRLRGALVDPRGDHRMAMAAAVAGLAAEGRTGIAGPECVGKSYPGFFEDLRSIGGRV